MLSHEDRSLSSRIPRKSLPGTEREKDMRLALLPEVTVPTGHDSHWALILWGKSSSGTPTLPSSVE